MKIEDEVLRIDDWYAWENRKIPDVASSYGGWMLWIYVLLAWVSTAFLIAATFWQHPYSLEGAQEIGTTFMGLDVPSQIIWGAAVVLWGGLWWLVRILLASMRGLMAGVWVVSFVALALWGGALYLSPPAFQSWKEAQDWVLAFPPIHQAVMAGGLVLFVGFLGVFFRLWKLGLNTPQRRALKEFKNAWNIEARKKDTFASALTRLLFSNSKIQFNNLPVLEVFYTRLGWPFLGRFSRQQEFDRIMASWLRKEAVEWLRKYHDESRKSLSYQLVGLHKGLEMYAPTVQDGLYSTLPEGHPLMVSITGGALRLALAEDELEGWLQEVERHLPEDNEEAARALKRVRGFTAFLC